MSLLVVGGAASPLQACVLLRKLLQLQLLFLQRLQLVGREGQYLTAGASHIRSHHCNIKQYIRPSNIN